MMQPSRKRRASLAALLLWFAGADALAHHSFGEFDQQNAVELEGTLTRIEWQNPHVHLELTTGQGVWRLESAGTNLLTRMGIDKERLALGERVRVAAYPSRQKPRYAYTANLLKADGTELVLFRGIKPRWQQRAVGFGTSSDRFNVSVATGPAAGPNRGLFGVWGSDLANPEMNPAALARGSEHFPYTLAGKARRDAWLSSARPPVSGCVAKGMPLIMEQPFPMQFVDRGDRIELLIEEYDVVRRIELGAAGARPAAAPTPLGHSRGRWEGRTLVVETVGAQGDYLDQHGTPQSPAAGFVERFTPSADGRRLDYVLTVTDPAVFTRPVEMRRSWAARPDDRVMPFRCRE